VLSPSFFWRVLVAEQESRLPGHLELQTVFSSVEDVFKQNHNRGVIHYDCLGLLEDSQPFEDLSDQEMMRRFSRMNYYCSKGMDDLNPGISERR
jgi:hypothetical protein